ncbi:helix-turn-helix domain-containing protein [Nocardia sp. CA-135398]|uniref:helix-turn-helix domain-containing protein n=1 Tax=Nocardia sp. CA-135398 TaxID=3239977 RepID=UPI003D95555C
MVTRGPPAGPTGSVIGRAFRILDSFDIEHQELSLSEIARRCEMPLSTAHRLLQELRDAPSAGYPGCARRAANERPWTKRIATEPSVMSA